MLNAANVFTNGQDKQLLNYMCCITRAMHANCIYTQNFIHRATAVHNTQET